MKRIAIVDDSWQDLTILQEYLNRYQQEHAVLFELHAFQSGIEFLERFQGEYDLIFFDIEMPGSDGLTAAREIRSKDASVGIVFCTSMAQYALEGYEVNAMDYMVKPVRYPSFVIKLDKIMRLTEKKKSRSLVIRDRDGVMKVNIEDIIYLEKQRDDVVFHTRDGIFRERGSIKDHKEPLIQMGFGENSSGYLVNFFYVKRIARDTVTLLSGEELPVSRRNKKQFLEEYMDYLGGI